MSKSAIIDGNTFSDLSGFYDEVERKLTHGMGWRMGRNLDALNDVLRGGFGFHDYGEELTLTWLNSGKSTRDLGQDETLKYIEAKLTTCHPSNIASVTQDLEDAKAGKGDSLFGLIVGIIRGHDHITLTLQ